MRGVTLLVLLGPLVAGCNNDDLAGIPPTGHVDGFACDPTLDRVASGATVSGEGLNGTVDTTTDSTGYFKLEALLTGDRTLDVVGPTFTDTIEVTILQDVLTRAPDPACLLIGHGGLSGRVCGTEGYWLVGARVFIEDGSVTYEDTTDIDGYFELSDVPEGEQTLVATKGSFRVEQTVQIVADTVSALPDPVCVATVGARLGVVTGAFDHIEEILAGTGADSLGFTVRDCVPSGASFCPGGLDSDGAVTLIEGEDATFVTELLEDFIRLSQLDVLFFNCGLAGGFIEADGIAQDNLRDWVDEGGSIYVSDWAYEVIRILFPGVLDFVGDESVAADARRGQMNLTQAATVVDATLASVLGDPSVQLAYDKGSWVALEQNQPLGVVNWVEAQAVALSSGGAIATMPALVVAPYGQGRIIFTTFHTHAQATSAMTEILRHIVFEL